MRHSEENIREAQIQDVIQDAVDILGEGHTGVDSLAFALHLKRSEALKHMLNSNGDVHFNSPLSDYERVLKELGATEVLCVPYLVRNSQQYESIHVWWSDDGILFVYTTYRGNRMNGGNFYYNWRPDPDLKERGINEWDFVSSGGYREDPVTSEKSIWSGHHDIREALKMNVENLRKNGKLLPKWVDGADVCLLHCQDYDDFNPENRWTMEALLERDRRNNARKSLLPTHVLDAISPVII